MSTRRSFVWCPRNPPGILEKRVRQAMDKLMADPSAEAAIGCMESGSLSTYSEHYVAMFAAYCIMRSIGRQEKLTEQMDRKSDEMTRLTKHLLKLTILLMVVAGLQLVLLLIQGCS